MNTKEQKINPSIITNRTYIAKKRTEKTIELAEKFKNDPQEKERLEAAECPVCFYIDSRLGGAMMCTVQCALCGKIMQFGNTSTDLLCPSCAKETGLCKHCGAALDLKQKRKFDFLKQ